jgi:hypothetical protein
MRITIYRQNIWVLKPCTRFEFTLYSLQVVTVSRGLTNQQTFIEVLTLVFFSIPPTSSEVYISNDFTATY